MQKTVMYLPDCARQKRNRESLRLPSFRYEDPPPFSALPTAKWFLATYVRDVWSRLYYLKGSMTSIYGTIIKIDSTKKITRKLQEQWANTASWCTNVGNERGEMLVSLLTTSERISNLGRMADGMMNRFSNAGQPHPMVLYTDRDCYKQEGLSKYQKLFHKWENLRVQVDCWHFMRRISKSCTNESHPLYGTFMAQVSTSIFEWDGNDMALLRRSKRSKLQSPGVSNPSDSAVAKAQNNQIRARPALPLQNKGDGELRPFVGEHVSLAAGH
ncbi:Uncharacterized protein APZ42_000804, partial [Daphnia magna]